MASPVALASAGEGAGPAAGISRLALAGCLGAIVAATVLARLPSLRFPLDQDGAVYAYTAMRWAEGGLPYRDVWDHKPPLGYLAIRVVLAVLPPSRVPVNLALRAAAALCDALSACLLFLLVRRGFGLGPAVLAGLLCGVFVGAPSLEFQAFQTEHLVVLFVTAGVLAGAVYADGGQYRYAALSGLLFGLALTAKQVAAPAGVAVWAWVTWDVLRRSGRAGLRRVAVHSVLLAGCAAVPWVLFVGYFALRRVFEDFWFCTYRYNVLYATKHRRGSFLGEVGLLAKARMFEHGVLWASAAAGTALALVRPAARRGGLLVALWLAAAFLGVALPGQFAYYYYLPTVAPLAAGAGVLLAALWGLARSPMGLGRRLAVLVPAGLVLAGLLSLAARRERGHYLQATCRESTNAVVTRLAHDLASRTEPAERLYVWGSRPQIYVLSGRLAPVPYLYNFSYNLELKEAFHFQRQHLEAIMAGLEKHEPPFIVATETDTLAGFPELAAYLADYYELERVWPGRPYSPTVYRRKPPS